jgi:hypothetical protein
MKNRIQAPISTSIAIAVGLIVLLGYFFELGSLVVLRRIFVQWGVILASVALLVGVTHLFSVHWRKLSHGDSGSIYSLVLILALIGTIGVVGYFGPTATWSMWVFDYLLVPVESSLMAIVAIILIYALSRLVRRKITIFSLVFLGVTLLLLLSAAPILGIEIPGLQGPAGLHDLIMRVPVTAGMRGILLGVSLGIVATGLRVLLGADRPYGG